MQPTFTDVAIFRNNHLTDHLFERKEFIQKDITLIAHWLRACRLKVLLVTDGPLGFGRDDFGLSAFINCLQHDDRTYVNFDITLAHLRSNTTDEQMGITIPAISRRIRDFRFDEPTHFTTTMHDQVWLFGFETFYYSGAYNHRNTNRANYPADRLSNAELTIITQFMENSKGGLFATGDHGALGRALCGSIKRVKSMRLWNSTPGDDEVGMTGPRRNDTNQVGHDAGTQFSDQSDDVPQTIEPKYYRKRVGSPFEIYPHPLLCSKLGVINVLPDHPHEGECRVPTTAAELAEYPALGGTTIIPEVIAKSRVISGNTGRIFTSSKSATQAQTFGAISAYDGHRAGIGRIVTDATWHHFVNVNLIGLVEGGGFDDLTAAHSATKHDGFLSTLQGLAHLAKIKEYFVNIGVWISPPAMIQCFNSKFRWKLIYSDRIMEAALVDPNVDIKKITPNLFFSIGTHARDVLGRSASQCQTLIFILDIIRLHIPRLIPQIDPWFQIPKPIPEPEPPLPWYDPTPIINIMLGTILVALRQEFPYPPKDFDEDFEKTAEKISTNAARFGLEMGLNHYASELKNYNSLLNESLKSLKNDDQKKTD
ncbi:MAG: hypothetical protein H7122_05340 [Chitinophagaceae bacterium]|nr:hypothetical protein [Chitinophagaceae bacterium]